MLFVNDLSVARKDDTPVDIVVELPHIPSPLLVHQILNQAVGELFLGEVVAPCVAFHKMTREDRNILSSISERGYGEWENIKAVVEILTKISLGNGFGQFAIGGCQKTNINTGRYFAAEMEVFL